MGDLPAYYEKKLCQWGFHLDMIKIPDKCEKGMKQC